MSLSTNHYVKSVLSSDSIDLISRTQTSYEEYYNHVSDDRLLSFALNPLLATLGSIEIIASLDDDDIFGTDGTDLVDKAKTLLQEHVLHILRAKLGQFDTNVGSDASTDENTSPARSSNQNTTSTFSTHAERKLAKMKKLRDKKKSRTGRPALIEGVKEEVNNFFEQHFDPVQELKNQLERKGKDWKSEDIDWGCVERGCDVLYISHCFDMAEWWKSVGGKRFKNISFAVPSVMFLPSSNGHQERTFSTCTHFNDELRARLQDEKFEMSVLISANKAMTAIKIPDENEAKKIISDTISKIESEDLGSKLESLGIDEIEREKFHEDATVNLVTPQKLF